MLSGRPIAVRTYRPDSLADDAPVVVWFHGRERAEDAQCLSCSRELGAIVVSASTPRPGAVSQSDLLEIGHDALRHALRESGSGRRKASVTVVGSTVAAEAALAAVYRADPDPVVRVVRELCLILPEFPPEPDVARGWMPPARWVSGELSLASSNALLAERSAAHAETLPSRLSYDFSRFPPTSVIAARASANRPVAELARRLRVSGVDVSVSNQPGPRYGLLSALVVH